MSTKATVASEPFYRIEYWLVSDGTITASERNEANAVRIRCGPSYFSEMEFSKTPGCDELPQAVLRIVKMLENAYALGKGAARRKIRQALGL